LSTLPRLRAAVLEWPNCRMTSSTAAELGICMLTPRFCLHRYGVVGVAPAVGVAKQPARAVMAGVAGVAGRMLKAGLVVAKSAQPKALLWEPGALAVLVDRLATAMTEIRAVTRRLALI